MFKSFLKEPIEDEEKLDTIEIKADIDKTVAEYLKSKIIFIDKEKFEMDSYGLIVPTAIPGWHFGDKLSGKWALHKDVLILTIGNDNLSHKFVYKIIQHTKNTLILKEVLADENYGSEIEFFRQ